MVSPPRFCGRFLHSSMTAMQVGSSALVTRLLCSLSSFSIFTDILIRMKTRYWLSSVQNVDGPLMMNLIWVNSRNPAGGEGWGEISIPRLARTLIQGWKPLLRRLEAEGPPNEISRDPSRWEIWITSKIPRGISRSQPRLPRRRGGIKLTYQTHSPTIILDRRIYWEPRLNQHALATQQAWLVHHLANRPLPRRSRRLWRACWTFNMMNKGRLNRMKRWEMIKDTSISWLRK